jgi:putative NIF3 family GTP cyclohydrolase 1 type 2
MLPQQNETVSFGKKTGRRQFITSLLTMAGTAPLLLLPGAGIASASFGTKELTIEQVIDLILKNVPGAPFPDTVDTIKAGDPKQKVKGIVTTMFATADVMEQAAKRGANFIIAHEPTFYSHTDVTAWLTEDRVYRYKKELLEKHGLVVWRFHDYMHALRPDGVQMGVLQALGWEAYYNAAKSHLLILPKTTLQDIVTLAKSRLRIPHVKIVGDLNDTCSRVVLIPGAAGGRMQMQALMREQPDLLIVGEINEWETSEYVRDLRHAGVRTSLIVLGHIQSEEPGMAWLAQWLRPKLPGIGVHHIPTTDALLSA